MRLTVLRYEILHVMSYLLASSAIARSSTTAASDREGAVGWTWANFTTCCQYTLPCRPLLRTA